MLNSPLSGNSRPARGNISTHKRKLLFGIVAVAVVPFMFSTFAANVTIGTGTLEFGQGSQQAIACDDTIYISLGEEWHANPTSSDTSNGFFRVRTATISNLNLETCLGRKVRLRLIDNSSSELLLGNLPDSKVLQITLPKSIPSSNVSDPVALGLSYLTSLGQVISGSPAANVTLNISGVSVYDGSSLSTTNADAMFYLDPTSTQVNIDSANVHRATVETVNNPN
ncbi:MAG: hypothetical protein WCJ89_03890 [Actinomycetes bacterium]